MANYSVHALTKFNIRGKWDIFLLVKTLSSFLVKTHLESEHSRVWKSGIKGSETNSLQKCSRLRRYNSPPSLSMYPPGSQRSHPIQFSFPRSLRLLKYQAKCACISLLFPVHFSPTPSACASHELMIVDVWNIGSFKVKFQTLQHFFGFKTDASRSKDSATQSNLDAARPRPGQRCSGCGSEGPLHSSKNRHPKRSNLTTCPDRPISHVRKSCVLKLKFLHIDTPSRACSQRKSCCKASGQQSRHKVFHRSLPPTWKKNERVSLIPLRIIRGVRKTETTNWKASALQKCKLYQGTFFLWGILYFFV